MTCHDSRCVGGVCIGHCLGLKNCFAEREETKVFSYSEFEKRADEQKRKELNIAYRRGWADAGQDMLPRYDALREELDFTRRVMWFAFIGWTTALALATLYIFFNG